MWRIFLDGLSSLSVSRAFRWREMLENGTHATIAVIAAAEKINCGSSLSCSAALVLCVLEEIAQPCNFSFIEGR